MRKFGINGYNVKTTNICTINYNRLPSGGISGDVVQGANVYGDKFISMAMIVNTK